MQNDTINSGWVSRDAIISRLWICCALCGLAAIVATGSIWLIGHLPSIEQHLPRQSASSDYVIGFVWSIIILVALVISGLPERRELSIVWMVKCFMVLGPMLLIDHHYSGDAFGYYLAASAAHRSFLPVIGNGTKTIGRATALFAMITGHSYFALKTVYSLFGLIACFCFYRAATIYLGERRPILLYLVALCPDVLLWSSILGKDPVVFMGVGLYCLGVVAWLKQRRTSPMVLVIAGVAIAFLVREWYALIMIPPALLVGATSHRNLSQRVLAIVLGAPALVGGATVFMSQFLPLGLESLPQRASSIFGTAAYGGSKMAIPVFHSPLSMIAFWPIGAFTVLFRPMPWEVRNIFMLAPMVEGVTLLILAICAAYHFRLWFLKDETLLWAFAYIGCWTGFYGFIGATNLGIAARMRLDVLPQLVLILLLLGTRVGRNTLGQRIPK